MPRLCGVLLPALAALAQSQIPTPAPPSGHSIIEGTVVDAMTHEPLKKCKVGAGGSSPVAFTDASGRFVFRELPAGNYWLSASKTGYTQAQDALGGDSNIQIALGAAETKKGVEIALLPGGSIGGRILNEDGLPVRNCDVTAVQPAYEQGRRELRRVTSGPGTDDKGEYRISGLAPGRYYLFAHCRTELPAAHPLLPHGDPRTPHDTYVPQFYGGGLDPSSGTRLAVTPGANLDGIDFEIRRVRAFTLRGSITASEPSVLPDNINVMLYSADNAMRPLMQFFSRTSFPGRTFQIRTVIPGSYRLFAFTRGPGRPAYAERTVEIGSAPPDPIEITLATGTDLKGSVQFDADNHPPPGNAQIILNALGTPRHMPQPMAEINKDGTFTLAGVMPGHWRLTVNTFGYIKSLSLAGQQMSPYDFQIPPGATGPLQVLLGTKMADVHVTVTGLLAGGKVWLLVFPEDLDRLGAGMERVITGGSQLGLGGLPPGRYRLLATDAPNLWNLQQRPDLLKALESSTQALDATEGGRVSATVELIPREELVRVLAEKEP